MRIVDWKKATQNFKKWKTKGLDFFNGNLADFDRVLPTPQLCELLKKLKDQLQYQRFGVLITDCVLPTPQLCELLKKLKDQLQYLRFGVLITDVLDFILSSNQFVGLEVLSVDLLMTADYLSPRASSVEYFDVGRLGKLHQLRELRINLDECISYSSFSFSGGLSALSGLKQLRILSLTSLKSNNTYECGFLTNLTELVELQLGDACALPLEAYKSISQLSHLRRLKLISGVCKCSNTTCQCEWVDLIGKLTNLVELDLEFINTIHRLNGSLLKMKKLRMLKVLPLEQNFTPNKTAFSVQDAEKSNIPDVLDGLTWLKSLQWGVYCPLEAFDTQNGNSGRLNVDIKDNTGTLTAVKDKLQLCLPNTEILILPVISPEDEEEEQ
ncbi:uncharacterized protein [Amphiura filiformis]